MGNNVFHFLQGTFANTSASCVNVAKKIVHIGGGRGAGRHGPKVLLRLKYRTLIKSNCFFQGLE